MKKIPFYVFSKLPEEAVTNEVAAYAEEKGFEYIELEKKHFEERHAGKVFNSTKSKNAAIIYARFSSAMQNEISIIGQVEDCLKFCEQCGYSVTAIYADMAQSGTNENRVAFQYLHNAILDEKYNGHKYVVYATNRFARNRRICSNYKADYKKFGVNMRYSTMPISDSAEGELLEANMEAIDAYFSQNLSKTVSRGLNERAKKCKYTGGYIPYGFKVNEETKLFEINEKEAENVREVFRMYVNGERYSAILKMLKDRNAVPRGGASEFKKACIRDMLSNEKYNGVYVYGKCTSVDRDTGKRNSHVYKDVEKQVRIADGVPRIVDEETFLAAQKRLEANKKGTKSRGCKERYLLSGLVYCRECGYAFSGNSRRSGRNKNKYVSYKCGNKNKAEKCTCKEVNRDYLENYVIDLILETFMKKEFRKLIFEDFIAYQKAHGDERKEHLTSLKEERNNVLKAKDNLLQLLEKGLATDTILERLDLKEKELIRIEQMIYEAGISEKGEITEKEFNQLMNKTKEYIRKKKSENLSRFIRCYVERIEIGKDDITVVLSISNIVVLLGGVSIYVSETLINLSKGTVSVPSR